MIKLLLGVMLVSYSLYSLILKPSPKRVNGVWAYVAGFLTGVLGSAFSTGGPPTIIYTTPTGWSKDDIKATLSIFFFTTGLIVAVAHAVTGLTEPYLLKHFALSVLAVLLGVWAGSVCYGRIEKENYSKTILILLAAMGVVMIVTAW